MANDILFRVFAKVVAAYRQGRALAQQMPSKQDRVPGVLLVFALPAFASGLVHVVIFAPLLLAEVQRLGLDLTSTALLLKQPTCLEMEWGKYLFPVLSSPCARPFVWSLGLFYGCVGVVAGLTIITAGFPKILITSNGLLFGLYLTWFLATTLSLVPTQSLSAYFPRLKVAYLFLAFYLAIAVPRLLGGRGYAKEKFEALFSGLFGLASGYLLGGAFGPTAVVFSGFLFLACTFLGMLIFESIVSPILWACRAVLGEKYYGYLELERGYAARTVWIASLSFWHYGRTMALAGFGICTLFPFLVALMYVFLLEGRA